MRKNKILVIDIETTDFFNKGGLIVEIGAALLNLRTGKINKKFDKIVRERNFDKRQMDSWIFNNSDLRFEQVIEAELIEKYRIDLQDLFILYPAVSWNTDFDFTFLLSRGFAIKILNCPMRRSTNYFKLPEICGYKFPKVQEAWDLLFPEKKYKEQHRAFDDAAHEAKIIYELYKRKIWLPE